MMWFDDDDGDNKMVNRIFRLKFIGGYMRITTVDPF